MMKKGARKHGRLFTYIHAPSSHPMAAVVVSKKVASSAVDRHTLRRRTYSAFHSLAPQVQVVCVAKKELSKATFRDIVEDMTNNLCNAAL